MSDRPYFWRTRFEPLPDITAYELALDRKYVNGSNVLSEHDCSHLGSALRHRVADTTGQRMDEIWRALSRLPQATAALPEAK